MNPSEENPYRPPESAAEVVALKEVAFLAEHLRQSGSVYGEGQNTLKVGIQFTRLLTGRMIWIVPIGAVGFLVAALFNREEKGLWVVGAMLLGMSVFGELQNRFRIRKMVAEGKGNFIPHGIEIGPEGFTLETSGSLHSYRWSQVEYYKADEELICLYLREGGIRIVHCDFFLREADFEGAFEFVRGNVPEIGT